MVTVRINDSSITEMRTVKDLLMHNRVVNFEASDITPEGYLTGDEFEQRCMNNISKFYHDKGLL